MDKSTQTVNYLRGAINKRYRLNREAIVWSQLSQQQKQAILALAPIQGTLADWLQLI